VLREVVGGRIRAEIAAGHLLRPPAAGSGTTARLSRSAIHLISYGWVTDRHVPLRQLGLLNRKIHFHLIWICIRLCRIILSQGGVTRQEAVRQRCGSVTAGSEGRAACVSWRRLWE
jgi:hypothetical protein